MRLMQIRRHVSSRIETQLSASEASGITFGTAQEVHVRTIKSAGSARSGTRPLQGSRDGRDHPGSTPLIDAGGRMVGQSGVTEPASVLLASDCHDLSQTIRAILHEGAIPVEHQCFDSAPVASASSRTGLVILDAGPQLRKALAYLRDIKTAQPEVPVIVLAEESTEDHVIMAFRLGARDYFRKPLDLLLLRDAVQNILKARQTFGERRMPLHPRTAPVLPFAGDVGICLPSAILKSLRYLEEHLSDDISLASLAQEAGMSKHHFCRAFKKHTGSTPIQTLHFMRISRAKNLLRNFNHTISMVALESGFNTIATFMRHFKQITGTTATRFRGSLRSSAKLLPPANAIIPLQEQ